MIHRILHRVNTKEALLNTPKEYGVEVDIRSSGNRFTMHHDPFQDGEDFEDWLSAYDHGTLILNVKEEGLEERLIEIMLLRGIKDYFFLDQSFPFLVKWAKLGERRCAVRVSEFESIESALTLAGKVDWVWVDCFSHFPLTHRDALRLKQAGFKLCLVSPELQGRDAELEIPILTRLLNERDIVAEAVCTKRPDIWQEMVCPK